MNMPFGRYKGQRVEDLPDSYLSWLMSIELRRPLREAVSAEWQARQPTNHERQYAPPRRATDAETVRETARSVVSSGFRSLAMQAHPDHGGTNEAMIALIQAKDWLLELMGDS